MSTLQDGRKPSNATRIARALQSAILNGEYAPGSKLPGQRELAARYEASLATVREAIGVVAATGLIEVRHGSGSIVRGSSEATGAFKGWLGMAVTEDERRDFLEARLMLEGAVVDRILARHDSVDFDALYDAASRLEATVRDPEGYLDADIEFHWALARAAGNAVMVRMLDAIEMQMRAQISAAIVWHMERNDSLMQSFESHIDLVDALAAGDAATARDLIRRMLTRSAPVDP